MNFEKISAACFAHWDTADDENEELLAEPIAATILVRWLRAFIVIFSP